MAIARGPTIPILEISRKYTVVSFAAVSALALVATLQNVLAGNTFVYSEQYYTAYNNFIIFRQSFFHLLNGHDLYARYAPEYGDYFKYSPFFAILISPFSLVSPGVGLFIWNLSGGLLLLAGLLALVPDRKKILLMTALLLPEMHVTMSNSQSNTHIIGLLLLCFGLLEKKDITLASVWFTITVFIKLFTLALAPLALMYRQRLRIIAAISLWTIVFVLIPALVAGPEGLLAQYKSWFQILKTDRESSVGVSFHGMLSSFGLEADKAVLLGLATTALFAPLFKWRMFAEFGFRSRYFVFCLLWMVLMNHKAESPTYIIVMTGIVYYAYLEGFSRAATVFLVASLLLTSLGVSDIVPRQIRNDLLEPYRIKALVPSVVMLFLWIDLMIFQRRPSVPQQLPGVL